MFFAPPKVKALSRYAEFGIYLQPRHFLIMLAIAVGLHAAVITIYALMPHERVLRIPVRVLNLKLSAGVAGVAGAQGPGPVLAGRSGPAPQSPAAARPRAYARGGKSSIHLPATKSVAAVPAKNEATPAEATLETPKKYVRAGEGDAGVGSGRGGAGMPGAGSGSAEMVQHYEQTISEWIAHHKSYPEAAKSQGIEGDAIVRIRIDRGGNILYNAIDRSSGNALIDEAVTAMVRASNPVPPVPEGYPTDSELEFLVPVSFRLQ